VVNILYTTEKIMLATELFILLKIMILEKR